MKFSTNWLNEYINFKPVISADKLADKLTECGFEATTFKQGTISDKVVLGTIIDFCPHPNADKLSLCQVNVGSDTRQIVCGAKNFKKNDKVVVALPGARLPGGIKIKKSKIREIESCGMICSESELGISDEQDGIMVLDKDILRDGMLSNGTLFDDYYQKDTILDISISSNRPDVLSHFGLAREISSILNIPLKNPEGMEQACLDNSPIEVEIKSDLCPRYIGWLIEGVKIKESPHYIKKHLESLGINLVNNVVDITNFVMLELGQPLHAFDVKNINKKITVKTASNNTEFEALDGSKVKLTSDDLTISDESGVIALAGVIGGETSKVTGNTRDIFIEAACFLKEPVRKTSRRLGIETDSSYRFSKGLEPYLAEISIKRACKLICDATGGKSTCYVDCYPKPAKKTSAISISTNQIASRVGYLVDIASMKKYFDLIGCNVTEEGTGNLLKVTPPIHRADLLLKEDLIEEYVRLDGFSNIPAKNPTMCSSLRKHSSSYITKRKLKHLVKSQGYNQIVNYAFCDSDVENKLLRNISSIRDCGLNISDDAIGLINPISKDLDVMRRSFLSGLIKVINHNIRHGESFGRLFEIGPVFYKSKKGDKLIYAEESRLGIASWGEKQMLLTKNNTPLILDVKNDLENVLKSLSVFFRWKEGVPDSINSVRGGRLILGNRPVGYLGELHPALRGEFELPSCVVGEISLDKLFDALPKKRTIKTFSKYPKIERDISVIISQDIKVSDVIDTIKKQAGKMLVKVYPFDIYLGDGIETGKMALGIRCVYQSNEKSLTDVEINALQDKIVNAVRLKFCAKLR